MQPLSSIEPEPEPDSPEPEPNSPEPEADSPEPEADSPEPEADSPEPELVSLSSRAHEPGATATNPSKLTMAGQGRMDACRCPAAAAPTTAYIGFLQGPAVHAESNNTNK